MIGERQTEWMSWTALMVLCALVLWAVVPPAARAQEGALIPPGEFQFTDQNGAPLAGGTVGFYVPNTLTPKATYLDPNLTTQNLNPIPLDSSGRAVIWGSGDYRQIVKDANGVVIWDQLTSSGFAGTLGSTQGANTVLAGPAAGFPALPTFRKLVGADLPGSLNPGTTMTTPDLTHNDTTLATTHFVWSAMAVRNVVQLGADPTCTTDSAPAFRTAIISGAIVQVPPGCYLFKSLQSAPCCAFNSPAVLVSGQTDFVIQGYGATIKMDNSITVAGSPPSAFHFDQSSNFRVTGLAIEGNRTALNAGDENVAIGLSSDINFEFEDIFATGNYGGNGAIFAGDWLVNGSFNRIYGGKLGQCYDLAFLLHVRIGQTHGIGADTNGTISQTNVGQKCLSIVYDVPNVAQNKTGTAFSDTSDVTVTGFDASNFNTGAFISSGNAINLYGNAWHDNPGTAAAAGGIGVLIQFTNGGNFTSVGHAPSHIQINDFIYNNGAQQPGSGVLIAANAVTAGNLITDITVGGNVSNNNNTGVDADTANNSKLTNVLVTVNVGPDVTQTTALGANILANASWYGPQGSGVYGVAKAWTLGLKPGNYGALATCNGTNQGQVQVVTDAAVNTWGTNITTGGAGDPVLAWCNGTNWTVVGK